MNYQETLAHLFSQLPMYQRIGGAAYKADLSTTQQLMEALGHPEQSGVKFIHVAGTNGKGSVSHLIASVLQQAGYKTGLFTSPHLKDFRERIRINGMPISENEVVNFVAQHSTLFATLQPSFFEMTAALALLHFKKENAAFAVIETGMGGRLDSTNVIIPKVSVITNIGLDHTQFLGSSIDAIAREKAGIIKDGTPVVCGQMHPDALRAIREVAKNRSALLTEAPAQSEFTSDLKGVYQQQNIATAVTTLRLLQKSNEINDQHLYHGLNNVVANTHLQGRWQQLSTQPLSICDVGHNEDGVRMVVEQIGQTPHRKLHMVWGMTSDKDIEAILNLLPRTATYYFCAAKIPRALDAETLAEKAAALSLQGKAYISVADAVETARNNAHPEDLVFIGGSVFVVAEVI